MRLFRRIATAVAAGRFGWRSQGHVACFVFLAEAGVLLLTADVAAGQETPIVTVTADAESIEEGETAAFTIARTAPFDDALTVSIRVDASRGTVLGGVVGAKTVDFSAGVATAAYDVVTQDTAVFQEDSATDDASQYVSVLLVESGFSYAAGEADLATVAVTDNDVLVEYSLLVPEGGFRIAEATAETDVTIRATTVTSGTPGPHGVAINTLAGTAGSGDDYSAFSDILRLQDANAWSLTEDGTRYTATLTFTLEVHDDNVDEDDETLELDLGFVPGFPTSTKFDVEIATVTIVDDDTAGVKVEPTKLAVLEGDTAGASYKVVLLSEPTDFVTVSVTVPPGAGLSVDEEYLYFFDHDWDEAQPVTVKAAHDADRMGGTATLEHSAEGGGYDSMAIGDVEVTIVDDDTQVSVAGASAAEGDPLEFRVELTGEVLSDVVLGLSTTAGTAASAVDYTAVSSGTLTIEAGDTHGTFSVSSTGDTLTEADETFTVTITGSSLPAGVSIGAATATGTIEDDDPLTASVSAAATVTEGSTAEFTVSLVGGTSTAAVEVTYSVTGTATPGTDYTAPAGTPLTIGAGSASGTLRIETLDDGVLDRGETLIVALTGATTGKGAVEVSHASASATLVIEDPGTVDVSVDGAPESRSQGDPMKAGAFGAEGETLFFQVMLTGEVSSDVEFDWSSSAGTATPGKDYTEVTSGVLTIKAGQTSGTFGVTTNGDGLTEANETLNVTISASVLPDGVNLDVATARGTILDDDDLTASVAADALAVMEGSPLSFTVILTGGESTADVRVGYSVGGTAVPGDDYTELLGSVTIAAGETAGTITINTLDDGVLEPAETVIVTLSEVTTTGRGGVSGTAGSATAAITDAGTVAVSVGPARAAEGDALDFPVTLSGKVSSDVVLACSTAPSTASDNDYTTMVAAVLTILAGDTVGTMTVSTTEDALAEGDETFDLTISATTLPSGVSVGVATATGTIEDDDELVVSVEATPPRVSEGHPALFAVSVSGGTSTADVVVSYSLGGTASEGSDYRAPAGSLAIGPGAGSGTIEIATVADDLREFSETLVVTLAEATTASGSVAVDAAPATVTITDDAGGSGSGPEQQILLSVSPSSVPEDGGAQTIEVAATHGDARQVSGVRVTVTVSGGTARERFDFKRVRQFDVTIAAGARSGRAEFTLTPLVDSAKERDETVVLTGVADLAGFLVSGAEIAIVDASSEPDPDSDTDSELPTVSITAGPSPVVEGTPVEFTVTRSHTSTDLSAVGVAVSETGSLLDGEPPIAIRFVAGETTALLALDTVDDEGTESASEVRATLTAGAGYELGTPASAVVSVVDNDAAPRKIVLTLDRGQVSEGDGPTVVWVTATLSGGLRRAATVVQVEVVGSGSAAAVDFTPVDPLGITIRAGASVGSARFTLVPENDGVDERDETIDISGSSILPVTPASLVLEDDDASSTSIALGVEPEIVPEGGGPVMVEVTALLDLSARSVDTPVVIALSDSGEPRAVDYRAVDSFELTIPSGELSGTASFTLTAEDDRVDEFDETIRISGTSPLRVSPALVQVKDDDEPSRTIQLSVAPQVVLEDAGATLVTVMASLDRSARVERTGVRIEVVRSAREDVVRFEPVEAFELTIPPEEVSAFGTFLLVPVNDMEEARTGSVEVRGEADLPVASALVSLLDDDDTSHARAWLSRFARTVASQSVETVEERLLGRTGAGNHVTLAGRRILGGRVARGRAGTAGAGVGPTLVGDRIGGGSLGVGVHGYSMLGTQAGWDGRGRDFSLGHSRAEPALGLLARSSFRLSSAVGAAQEEDHAAIRWTAWGRGALTNFQGREGDLSLRGDVVTGTVGVDVERGRFLSGLAIGFSRGEGAFSGGPEAEASLTGGFPYMRVRVSENLSLWGVVGYGQGDFSLTEGEGSSKETDIEFAVGAIGLRREVVSSPRGFGLGVLSDVLLARIESDPVPGLAAVGEEVNRVRLAMEGSYDHSLAGGGTLMPTLELGVRYDRGDAETGAGVEIGGGLRYVNAERGLHVEFAGRSLLTHQSSGLEEWGGSGSVTLDPGEAGRGLTLGLRSSWGAAHGGVRQFWSRQQMFDPAGGARLVQGGRIEAEAGYGLGREGGRHLLSPFWVLMLGEEGERGLGAGARYDLAPMFSLSLEVSRRRLHGAPSEDAIVLRGVLRRAPRPQHASAGRDEAESPGSAGGPDEASTSSPR